jgi:electron transfer flavoprotein beta subunit
MEISGRTLRVRRLMDNFRETLEIEFPALLTISMERYQPRYCALAGLEKSFQQGNISVYDLATLGITGTTASAQYSRTRVRKVFLRKAQKQNIILTGTPAVTVGEFMDKYENKISVAIGKSIEAKKPEA